MRIEYSATTDKDTVLNLTSHSCFNLAGQGKGDILSHDPLAFGKRVFTDPVPAVMQVCKRDLEYNLQLEES